MEIVGWLGSGLLAACSLPEAYLSWRRGHSRGLSWTFLLAWYLGEIFTLGYVVFETFSWPLILNYTLNIIGLGVVIKFKKWERI